MIVIHTRPDQDKLAFQAIQERYLTPGEFNLYGRNCSEFVRDVLDQAGVGLPHEAVDLFPSEYFKRLTAEYEAKQRTGIR
jgi:hypothetical protein